MRKHRGHVTERRLEKLALVSVDICSPLPKSRKGFTYFLQIADNFSMKSWAFPLADRKAAPESLNQWKLKAEREIHPHG